MLSNSVPSTVPAQLPTTKLFRWKGFLAKASPPTCTTTPSFFLKKAKPFMGWVRRGLLVLRRMSQSSSLLSIERESRLCIGTVLLWVRYSHQSSWETPSLWKQSSTWERPLDFSSRLRSQQVISPLKLPAAKMLGSVGWQANAVTQQLTSKAKEATFSLMPLLLRCQPRMQDMWLQPPPCEKAEKATSRVDPLQLQSSATASSRCFFIDSRQFLSYSWYSTLFSRRTYSCRTSYRYSAGFTFSLSYFMTRGSTLRKNCMSLAQSASAYLRTTSFAQVCTSTELARSGLRWQVSVWTSRGGRGAVCADWALTWSLPLARVAQISISSWSSNSFQLRIDNRYMNIKQIATKFRSTSFRLGTTPPVSLSSYRDHYPPKEALPPDSLRPVGALTCAQGPTSYLTTQLNSYRGQAGGPNTLDSDNLQRLRSHNFSLGQQGSQGQYITSMQAHYPPKPIDLSRNKDSQKQQILMRAHNHKFDQGVPTDRRSVYDSDFVRRAADRAQPVTKDQKCSVSFGNDRTVPKQSTTHRDYVPKEYAKPELKTHEPSNVQFGIQQGDYKTTSGIYLPSHGAVKPYVVTQQLKNELRKTHYSLGGSGGVVLSQKESNFVRKDGLPAQMVRPVQNGVQLGTDRTNYSTTNKRELPARQRDPSVLAQKPVSNLVLGKMGGHYSTEGSNYGVGPQQGPENAAGLPCTDSEGGQRALFAGPGSYLSEAKESFQGRRGQRVAAVKPDGRTGIGAGRGGLQGTTEYRDQFVQEHGRKLKAFHSRATNLNVT